MGLKTIESVSEKTTQPSKLIVRYGWGNEEFKTWFLTKTRRAFVPKGSRLLMVFGCEQTGESIQTFETYPIVNDVVSDIDGSNIKIKTVDWV